MMQIGLIGIAAGAAAALLFASVTSGSLLAVVLFYLAPLPMMIAGLGWSHWSALIGALFGATAIAAIFGSVFFLGFLASAGLPAWWLSYLALLARPVASGGNGATPTLEWYPTGRLVIWSAILGALIVVVAIVNFGTDADSFHAAMRATLAKLLGLDAGKPAGTQSTMTGLDFLAAALPPAAAVLATINNAFNLWLAGRIVKFSGRLARPWPQIPMMTFPRLVLAALAIAVGVSLAGGFPGILASVVAASLMMAYGVLGFSVLHAITQGVNGRGFLLGGSYAAAMLLGWPVLALCLLGLIEAMFGLRARVARTRGPPTLYS
jgi:hypothetical protein